MTTSRSKIGLTENPMQESNLLDLWANFGYHEHEVVMYAKLGYTADDLRNKAREDYARGSVIHYV